MTTPPTEFSVFTGNIGPLTRVVPFTHRDNATYLRILQELIQYVNTSLVPEITAELQRILDEYQLIADTYAADIETTKDSWVALFDAFKAEVAVGAADIAVTKAGWQTAFDAFMVDVTAQLAILSDAAIADLILDDTVPISETRAALDIVVPQIIPTPDYGYVVTTFTGNGLTNEKLSVLYSPDGKTLFGGGANQVYTDSAAGNSLRDPSTLRIGSKWFTAYTVNNGISKNFRVIESTDLINWTVIATIDVSGVADLERAWAPELIQDNNGDVYAFFSRLDGSYTGKTYYVKATNAALTAWAAPVAMLWTAPPANLIDPTYVFHDGLWYCFYKQETTKFIERATSPTLTGTYTIDRTGNWHGWGGGLEGVSIVKATDTVWRLYADRYDPFEGYHWAESTNLADWTVLTPISVALDALDGEQVVRHGSFVKLLDAPSATNAMAAVWGKQERHAEFSGSTANAADVLTGPGTLATFSEADHTQNAGSFVTNLVPGQLQIQVAGNYSVNWVAEHAGTMAGADSFMAIKSPGEAATYATLDIAATSGASSVGFAEKYFRAGSIIQFYCKWGTAIPTLSSHITIHKS